MTHRLTGAFCAPLALVACAAAANADAQKTLCNQQSYEMGLKWQQQSAEVAALQRQSFALATMRLDQALEQKKEGEKLAIITDLDETVIDNSDLLVRDMRACHDYTTWDTWKDWERNGHPRVIPGAKDFLDHADEKGVAIFYISDRYDENKAQTVASLEKLDLPQVSDTSVLLLGPPKQDRRASVVADYKVVLQLGDTLHDFSEDYVSSVPLDQQRDLVAKEADRFGDDWIVLPNATYGTWRKADLTACDAPLVTE